MKYATLLLLTILTAICSRAQTPKKSTAFDFESPLNVKEWWVDNKGIILTQCGMDCMQLPGSGQCLRIQWDRVTGDKPHVWMTDIKIDTLGKIDPSTWLSFSANTGDADSVYFQFIIFTKDEKDKWGSQAMIGFSSPTWKTVKIRLSGLRFENWGKGTIPTPDLNVIVPARIEIGIRSAQANKKGVIDARIDNIVFTNYEP
jgi:hypothetical protein